MFVTHKPFGHLYENYEGHTGLISQVSVEGLMHFPFAHFKVFPIIGHPYKLKQVWSEGTHDPSLQS